MNQPAEGLTGYVVIPFTLPFLAFFIYVLIQLIRDLIFYSKNEWDFTRDSGIPNAWVSFASRKYYFSKKNSVRFALPILLLILGAIVAFLIRAVLAGT